MLFLHLLCESMVIPVLVPTLASPISAEFDMMAGASAALHKFFYAFTIAAYPVAVFLCAPVLGAVSDAAGRRGVLLLTVAGAAAGCFLQGLALEFMSLPLFLFARIAVGATAGVDGVIQAAMVERCETQEKKNAYLAATLLMMTLGFIVGPAFAACFINEGASSFVWSIPFFITALLFLICLIPMYKNLPKPKGAIPSAKGFDWFKGLRDILELGKIKEASRLLAIFTFSQVAGGCFSAVLPLVLAEDYGFSAKQIGYFISVQSVFIGIIFGFAGPWLLKKFSARAVLRFAMVATFLGVLYPLADFGKWIWALTALQALGFPLGYYSILAEFSNAAEDNRRGWILSVISSMWGLTVGAGLLLSGLVIMFSNTAALLVCAGLAGVSILLSMQKAAAFKLDVR